MTDDLITRMAEAAYKRQMHASGFDASMYPLATTSPEFHAEYLAVMEMLRDMVREDMLTIASERSAMIHAAAVEARRRKRRLSLF